MINPTKYFSLLSDFLKREKKYKKMRINESMLRYPTPQNRKKKII